MDKTAEKQKKRINSRDKGKRGERDFRNMLWHQGFENAYRSQQYCGSANSADVICPELPKIHFEVKYTEKLNLYDAIDQAKKDCGDKTPVVSYRKNNHEWLIVMRSEDWFALVKESEHVSSAQCPECKTTKVCKNGKNYKSSQQYLCLNDACVRHSFVID